MKNKEKITKEYLDELFEYYGIKTNPDKKGIWIKGKDGKLVSVDIMKLIGLEKQKGSKIKTWEILKKEVKKLIDKNKKESFKRTFNGMIYYELEKEVERLTNTYLDEDY